jgi:alpha-maltose-1-phosphate synthase
MACGTAVVGSRVGGVPEVVADGETGLLVPPGDPAALADAINVLLAAEHRAAQMGRLGRVRAETQFGWDTVAAQTVALYTALTEGRLPG